MKSILSKIKIIDVICTKHPSYGVEKGWSKYVGGMADTGEWFFRKMLDVPQDELQAFLDEIIIQEEKAKIPKALTEEEKRDSKIIRSYSNGAWMTELEYKRMKKAHDDLKYKLLFG